MSSPYGKIVPPELIAFGIGVAFGFLCGASLVAAIFIFGHGAVWH